MFESPWYKSNSALLANAKMKLLRVIGETYCKAYQRSIIQPNRNPQTPPKMIIKIKLFLSLVIPMRPADSPINPQANICQGVQGPWPINILDTKAVVLPVTNPSSGPNETPPTIMTKLAVPGYSEERQRAPSATAGNQMQQHQCWC